jgi:putative endonuclease
MSYFVYMMASKSRVLYIGMTNSLDRRLVEHKNDLTEGFAQKISLPQVGVLRIV